MGNCCSSENQARGPSEGFFEMDKSVAGAGAKTAATEIDDAALQAMQTGSRDELKERVSLNFSLRDLPSFDAAGKSDPFIVIYSMRGTEKGAELCRSEVQWEQASPDFVKQIEMDYYFEEVQQLRVEAYDCDKANQDDLS